MKLIDKSAVEAEIKRRIKGLKDCHADTVVGYAGEISGLERLLSFLDTLEVKEVDFEKELDEWMKYGPHTNYPWCNIPDAIRITAEHFFELGLNAKEDKL